MLSMTEYRSSRAASCRRMVLLLSGFSLLATVSYNSILSGTRLMLDAYPQVVDIVYATNERNQSRQGSLRTMTEARRGAWLLSFPNSGTSYTMMNLQRMTNTSAASNYAKEVIGDQLIRLRPDIEHSPYLINPTSRHVPNMVLVKTHCTGFCDDCKDLIHTQETFENGCSESLVDPRERNIYNASTFISRVVHLIRHPFDNLVSRKHLGVKIRRRHPLKQKGIELMTQDTPEGLLAWCKYIDNHVVDVAFGWSEVLDEDVKAMFRVVPCASDLFRMVQWHNLAIETAAKMNVPVHYLHYEDYDDRFEETVTNLAGFLDLPLTRDSFQHKLPFVNDRSYYDRMFDDNLSRKMTAFIRRIASPECWHLLRRYLIKWDDEALEGRVQTKRVTHAPQ